MNLADRRLHFQDHGPWKQWRAWDAEGLTPVAIAVDRYDLLLFPFTTGPGEHHLANVFCGAGDCFIDDAVRYGLVLLGDSPEPVGVTVIPNALSGGISAGVADDSACLEGAGQCAPCVRVMGANPVLKAGLPPCFSQDGLAGMNLTDQCAGPFGEACAGIAQG